MDRGDVARVAREVRGDVAAERRDERERRRVVVAEPGRNKARRHDLFFTGHPCGSRVELIGTGRTRKNPALPATRAQ